MELANINPCPVCGSNPCLVIEKGKDPNSHKPLFLQEPKTRACILCDPNWTVNGKHGCGRKTEVVADICITSGDLDKIEKEVIEKWNKSAPLKIYQASN